MLPSRGAVFGEFSQNELLQLIDTVPDMIVARLLSLPA